MLNVSCWLRLIICSTTILLVVGCATVAPTHPANESEGSMKAGSPESTNAANHKHLKGVRVGKVKKVEKKTKITPSNMYKLLVAEIAAQRGKHDIAIQNYLDVAKESRDKAAVARAAQLANYAQNQAKSLEAIELWVQLSPEDSEARRSYAAILLRIGRAADAIPQYEKMLSLMDDAGRGYGIVTSQLVRVPDRSIAQAVMEKLVAKRQDNANAMFAYGHLLLRLAKFDESLKAIDTVLNLKPEWSNAIILKARTLALGVSRDKALEYLKDMLADTMSDNVEVRISYARMLTENREFEPALAQFTKLTELEPKNVEIHYLAGVLALQLAHFDTSDTFLRRVLQLGGRIYESNYYLGQIAEQKQDADTAINRYSMVKHGELYFNAQIRVVALLADQGKFNKSQDFLHTVRPGNAKQQLQLFLLEGDVLREAGRYQDAIVFYTKLLDKTPKETSIRYARALIAEKLGELSLVESDLQDILKDEPKNAQVLNALGYTLADRTERYDEALGYIQRALEIEPEDAAVMDSMGWVQYRLGNYQGAIVHLKKATEIDQDPEIAAHFGEVLWVMGNKKDALEIWEKSLQDNPKHEVLMNVMKRFGL